MYCFKDPPMNKICAYVYFTMSKKPFITLFHKNFRKMLFEFPQELIRFPPYVFFKVSSIATTFPHVSGSVGGTEFCLENL